MNRTARRLIATAAALLATLGLSAMAADAAMSHTNGGASLCCRSIF